jgi:hypothetical protein
MVSLLASAASTLLCQEPPTLRLPNGAAVEVLGLRRWTITMIQDSLGKYSPRDSLQSHACAAVLRYKLKFADASAALFMTADGKDPPFTVVTVREPQDSALVHFRALPFDSVSPDPTWRQVTDALSRGAMPAAMAVRAYLTPSASLPPSATAADSADVGALVAFLRSRNTDEDRRKALAMLQSDPNMYDRVAATLVLANFSERDDTWWALVDAMRETDGPVKSFATDVLRSLSLRYPRKIDWRPRSKDLHAMLNGTSLFVIPTLLDVLVRTEIGPDDAGPLLRGGGEIVLEYLRSSKPYYSRPSRALLVKLRGDDLGAAAEPWRAWIATL